MADEDSKTFDLTIPDAGPEEIAALYGGISLHIQRCIAHGEMNRAQEAADVLETLMIENPDAGRYLLLDSDLSDDVRLAAIGDDDYPAEVLDELDLEIVDGHVMDAERMTDIEVE